MSEKATDFQTGVLPVTGAMRPTGVNTPLDIRTVIEDISEIELIPNPFIGMLIYVKDEKQVYQVNSLKDYKKGPIKKPNALIDEYAKLIDITDGTLNVNLDGYVKEEDIANFITSEALNEILDARFEDCVKDADMHNHDNKLILDGITQDNIDNWNDADAKIDNKLDKSVFDEFIGIPADEDNNIEATGYKLTLQRIKELEENNATSEAGKSAYEIAVDKGFEGTEEEWLASLKGADGSSVTIVGKVATEADLVSVTEVANGEGYLVEETGELHVYVDNAFVNVGQIQGPSGKDGKSAYESAKDKGFVGSEAAWVKSLKGDAGEKGEKGDKGDSPYTLAVKNGFDGTEIEWLESLKGVNGLNGIDGVDGKDGKDGTSVTIKGKVFAEEQLEELDKTGLNNGDGYLVEETGNLHVFTDGAFVNVGRIQGINGNNGKSAYEIAVEAGFEGSKAGWIASLKGEQGEKGADGKDGLDGRDGKDGKDGKNGTSVTIKGKVAIADELLTLSSLNLVNGDGYLVEATGDLHVFTNGAFVNVGKIQGPAGDKGKSAYDIAVELTGFEGNEAAWLVSLKGEKGSRGPAGTNGQDGIDGKSAYEMAKELEGFVGSEEAWLESLRGRNGADGKDGVDGKSVNIVGRVANESDLGTVSGLGNGDGYLVEATGNLHVWTDGAFVNVGQIQGPQGKNGKSAFEIAVDLGFDGTEFEFIQSLQGKDGATGSKGQDGVNGKSAYELAKEVNNFEGTEEEWLESLRGKDGTSVNIVGKAANESILAGIAGLNNGDGYLVEATGDLHVWIDGAWTNVGKIQGPQGPKGDSFTFEDLTAEQLTSLKGAKGDKGDKGEKGETGTFDKNVAFPELLTQSKYIINAINELYKMINNIEIPEDPEVVNYIYYGYFDWGNYGETTDVWATSFDDLTAEQLLSKTYSYYTKIDESQLPLEKAPIINGTIPGWAVIYILTPVSFNCKVFKHDAMTNSKVAFVQQDNGADDGRYMGANGEFTLQINGIDYQVWGFWNDKDSALDGDVSSSCIYIEQ